MASKMRIQLLDKTGAIASDRLVDQTIETYQGPKEVHDGPMRIEFVFNGTSDVEKVIEYLRKLSGFLPIEQKNTTAKKTPLAKEINETSREILLEESLKGSKGNQDMFIKLLREKDFVFITGEHLTKLIPETYEIKTRHLEQYEWLLRRTKEAKDPRADKYDISLLIGIKILAEKRSDKVLIYMNGALKETKKLEIPKGAINFKQTNLIQFPHYMTYEEREKWGIEHRQLMANENKVKSKFYVRWERDVNVGDELQLKQRTKKDE